MKIFDILFLTYQLLYTLESLYDAYLQHHFYKDSVFKLKLPTGNLQSMSSAHTGGTALKNHWCTSEFI